MLMFVAGVALGAVFSKFWIAGYEYVKVMVLAQLPPPKK
jgi:hypothetical protein